MGAAPSQPDFPGCLTASIPDARPDSELRARLAECTVLIVGCGGLGSNAAEMLVRSGVGHLVLVDFDVVAESNLNRQFYFADQVGRPKTEALAENLRRIRKDVDLRLVQACVDPEGLKQLLAGVDAVVEAVDTAEGKAMIISACMEARPDLPLVTGSGLAGHGPTNAIVTERMAENLYVVGDLTSDVRDGHSLFASRVLAASAAEAHTVVRVLLGYPEP